MFFQNDIPIIPTQTELSETFELSMIAKSGDFGLHSALGVLVIDFFGDYVIFEISLPRQMELWDYPSWLRFIYEIWRFLRPQNGRARE
jgi:hypothetical protein